MACSTLGRCSGKLSKANGYRLQSNDQPFHATWCVPPASYARCCTECCAVQCILDLRSKKCVPPTRIACWRQMVHSVSSWRWFVAVEKNTFWINKGCALLWENYGRLEKHGCHGTFAYLDNITVGGKTQEEHDCNLERFLSVAKKSNLTFNETKYVFSDSVDLLGYGISKGTLQTDPERVKALLELSQLLEMQRSNKG